MRHSTYFATDENFQNKPPRYTHIGLGWRWELASTAETWLSIWACCIQGLWITFKMMLWHFSAVTFSRTLYKKKKRVAVVTEDSGLDFTCSELEQGCSHTNKTHTLLDQAHGLHHLGMKFGTTTGSLGNMVAIHLHFLPFLLFSTLRLDYLYFTGRKSMIYSFLIA